ncbi:MAG: type II toxin-antitoxin system RelE/ParE family toxin [Verrucomicrobiaceae bacterium]|nr:MAG: type II toxin-antitoxin system RelE/ParE family toxin [Verrucomicrobiaceae bacterium]
MSISFHPNAAAELEDATHEYVGIDPALGLDFRKEVERTIGLIGSHPHIYHLRSGLYRRANLGGFPYHLIFVEEDGNLRMIAVAHNSRKPHFWADRLDHHDLP